MEHTYEQKMQAQMIGIWAFCNGKFPPDVHITTYATSLAKLIGLDDELTRNFVTGYLQAALKM
jgi:hypothetical protein